MLWQEYATVVIFSVGYIGDMTGVHMTSPWWEQLKSVTLHDDSQPAPQLWPEGASEEYITARLALRDAEMDLRDKIEHVASLRRALPDGTRIGNYRLTEGPRDLHLDGPIRSTTLQDVFDMHDTLVIYHLMFHPEDDQACAMCSLWVDGFPGIVHHIEARTALAVVAKAPIEKLRTWGRTRNWHGIRLLSSYDSTFSRDLQFETERGGQWPSFAVFARQENQIWHRFTQCADLPVGERGNDLLSPVWNIFDLLPQGCGNWLPDNDRTR
jgi:predicted dithiol-disulfide oxidoreductase (DUF899 family)